MKKWALIYCLFFIPLSYADYDEGVTAFEQDDFINARNIWYKFLEDEQLKGGGKGGNSNKIAAAQYGLGKIYWFGNRDVPQDYEKAHMWFSKAAEAGNSDAQLILGFIYYQGLGQEKNEAKAREWMLSAAEAGIVVAQFNLAQFYLKGIGGEKDQEQAVYWLRKAADQGDEKAGQLLGLIAKHKFGEDQIENEQEETSESVIPQQTSDTDGNQSVLHGADWLLDNNGRYAIQAIAFNSEEEIADFYNRNINRGEWAYYAKSKKGRKIYILLRCCFDEKDQAQRAIEAFPEGLKKNNPFIVELESIRKVMVSG